MTLMDSSKASKPQYIADLARAGFALIPLMPGTKLPFSLDWVDTEPDPLLTAEDFPDNYGVVLRDDLMVLDIDPRHFNKGDNPLDRLVNSLGGQMFDTFTVKSGGGGLHIYFRKPEGFKLRMKVPAYPGIECKTKGHQLVGPGSIHPNTGQEYTIVHGSPYHLLYAPDELLQTFVQVDRALEAGLDDYADDEATCQRFRTFLSTAPVAIEGQGGDTTTFKTACMGREFGLSEQATFELMRDYWNDRCAPPWTDSALAKKVANAYAYSQNKAGNRHPAADFSVEQWEKDRVTAEEISNIRWDLARDGGLKDTVRNVMNYFQIKDYQGYRNPLLGLVRFNMFAQLIEFNHPAPWHVTGEAKTQWTKDDDTQFRAYLSQRQGWSPSKDLIRDGVLSYAKTRSYHPIRQYFTGLQWDGTPRLHKLFSYYAGALDAPYTRAVAKCFMVSAVARIMEPGCKVDHMPILEGPQGTGKSSFCQVLGEEYHREIHIDAHEKDTRLKLLGKLIIEVPEIVCIRRSDVDSLKAFLSCQKDPIRKPYGHDVEDLPRQCVFIGTTNPGPDGRYMQDQTGNRRFWPIETTKIRLDELAADRDQLWAEAFHLYKQGEKWHFVDVALIADATAEQKKRLESEVWAESIQYWLARQAEPYQELRSEFIANDILNIPVRYHNTKTFQRIAMAMDELGWKSDRILVNGKRIRGYISPERYEFKQMLDGV